MPEPITQLDAETFQHLVEYVSLQVLCGVKEHEARIHDPNNPKAAMAVNNLNRVRKEMLARLRARIVKE